MKAMIHGMRMSMVDLKQQKQVRDEKRKSRYGKGHEQPEKTQVTKHVKTRDARQNVGHEARESREHVWHVI